MSRIDELIAALCPEGVGFKTLGELLDYEQPGKYLVASTAYDNSYWTPVLTAGQTFILGYTDETSGIYPASPQEPVIIFDDFTTAFKWVDFPFKAKSSAMKMLTLKAGALDSLKYVFFAMQMIAYTPQDHARQWIGTYSKFLIPVPPLEVQRQIVKVLDTFTTLEAELEAELEARRRQYQYYRDALLTFGEGTDAATRVRWVTLGEICQINRGRVMSKDYLRDNVGSYPVYSSQTANDGVFGFIDTFDYDFESITWTTDGANAGSLFYHCDKKFSITNVCGLLRVIDSSQINTKFLYYALGQVTKRHVSDGMGNPKLMGKVMSQIKVAIPPLEVQARIVAVLDQFDTLVNDITAGLPAEIAARRQQYAYYRDRLLTFKEAV
ncbi:restriction endonuclease subunit S [Xylella fastidiosa subsp. multiplex]|uniref:restriction endonuclease subunit S n=1 Tax=Xylella fastidiosa TaxID=2371 RepID=UPI0035D4F0EB